MGLAVSIALPVLLIVLLPVCLTFEVWPWQMFSSELTNREFEALMHLVFTDPNATLDQFNVTGGGYQCWIANGYFGFEINKVKHFSPWQRVLFFRRFNKWKRRRTILKEDRLNRAKLAEICFHKQVDSILEEED